MHLIQGKLKEPDIVLVWEFREHCESVMVSVRDKDRGPHKERVQFYDYNFE